MLQRNALEAGKYVLVLLRFDKVKPACDYNLHIARVSAVSESKERRYLTRGEAFSVFKTNFAKIGIGICYDLEFPESARIMAIQGAQIIFFPSAEMKPLQAIITRYLQTRASENQVYVAFANRVGAEGITTFFGGSLIISPDSKILASCSGTESVAIAKLDLKKLTRRRTEFAYLKHRLPTAYTPLSS
jgi:predicted amidohydrolase